MPSPAAGLARCRRSTGGQGGIRTAATLAKEHGLLKGWFTGTGATVAREIPQCAVYFLTYDSIRRACEKAAGPGCETAGIVLAGGSAGVVQWVATYPLDVIKSRMQAFPPGTYNGFLDCAMKSLRAEGPGVFVRGLEMALLRAFPLHACRRFHISDMRDDPRDAGQVSGGAGGREAMGANRKVMNLSPRLRMLLAA